MKLKIAFLFLAGFLLIAGDTAVLEDEEFYLALRAAGYPHEHATYIVQLPKAPQFHPDADTNPPHLVDGNTATFVSQFPKYAFYSRVVSVDDSTFRIISRYLYDFRPNGFGKEVNPLDVSRALMNSEPKK